MSRLLLSQCAQFDAHPSDTSIGKFVGRSKRLENEDDVVVARLIPLAAWHACEKVPAALEALGERGS